MSVCYEKDLFNLHRFEQDQNYFFLFLYIPFGLILLAFRLIIYAAIYPLVTPLPRTQIRTYLLKCVRLLFGIFVKEISISNKEHHPYVKVIVANHITIMDHLVLDSIFDCRKVDDSSHFNEVSSIPEFPITEYRNSVNHIRQAIFASDVTTTLIFPEGAQTNGKHGFMKFQTWPFALSFPIQPIVIRLLRIPYLKISAAVLGAKPWVDLCWFFFRPYSIFVIRFLPVVKNNVTENAEDMSKRVQFFMAHYLELIPTDFSLKDKEEYEKRITVLSSNFGTQIPSALESKKLNEYPSYVKEKANQVRSITSDVPLDVILPIIEMTGSVYKTVKQLLEDKVANCNISDPNLLKEVLENLDTSVSTFGKTSKARMISFQDRKNALILAAKIRYLKKQELSDICCTTEY